MRQDDSSDRSKPMPKHDAVGVVKRSFTLLLCLGTLAGVLIWAKLRLVTDIPRSAYADPREKEPLPESDAVETQGSDTVRLEGDTPNFHERP